MSGEIESPRYKPGDTANGHVLNSDGVWVPIAPSTTHTAQGTRAGSRYWGRYVRRLPWCMLAFAVLMGLAPVILATSPEYSRGAVGLADVVFSALFGAVLYGPVACLVAAIFRSRK